MFVGRWSPVLRLDPAVLLPPGIFHTGHIVSDGSLRTGCCAFTTQQTSASSNNTIRERTPRKSEEESCVQSLHWVTPVRLGADTSTHPSLCAAPSHGADILSSQHDRARIRKRQEVRKKAMNLSNTWRHPQLSKLAPPGDKPPTETCPRDSEGPEQARLQRASTSGRTVRIISD